MVKIIPPTIPFRGFNNPYHKSHYVIIGYPYDGTTVYRPGSRLAPSYIRKASTIVDQMSCFSNINVDSIGIHDVGDVEIVYDDLRATMRALESIVFQVIKDKKVPIIMGGEHTALLPIIKAVKKVYNIVNVIIFDAHMDFYLEWPEGSKITYATVIRRVYEELGDDRIFLIGVRAYNEDEINNLGDCKINVLYMKDLSMKLEEFIDKLPKENIYMSVDVDVLDPSVINAVSHPEPGGLTYREFINIIKRIFRNSRKVIGIDIVEYNPLLDLNGNSAYIVTRLIYDIIGFLYKYNH
ncbi:MAG: agmatinase [Thermoprotei archaeon]|nr:agmatinase [Thermoprotei archaeon]